MKIKRVLYNVKLKELEKQILIIFGTICQEINPKIIGINNFNNIYKKITIIDSMKEIQLK